MYIYFFRALMIELLENKELKEDFFKKAILHENSYGTGRDMLVIPELVRNRQYDQEFKVILSFIVSLKAARAK